MRFLLALLFVAMTAGAVNGASLWVNNITVNEYNMTWDYTETFTGMDAIATRINIERNFGDNDSFINAWELLNADKEMRRKLQSSINNESDVKINNGTGGIEVVDVDSTLSPELLGGTHSVDTVVNRYNITYRFKESIFNASSIWVLGQADTPITIIMPSGVDVTDIRGLNNITKKITNHTELSGIFSAVTTDRGEITLDLARNVSKVEMNISSPPDNITETNSTKPLIGTLSRIRDASIVMVGAIIILLVYLFKVRRH